MDETWNDVCWRVLGTLVESGQKVGEPTTPIFVLLGPKGAGKSFLAKGIEGADVVPFNWYFGSVARGMIPYELQKLDGFVNVTEKESALFPAMQAIGTYRDLLINIGDAMETMKGFVQLMYYMKLTASVRAGNIIINDSVRRDWEVNFFMLLAVHGWPVHFVEIAGRGEYSDEHKTEKNYVNYLNTRGWPVAVFDNAPHKWADGAKFKQFLQNLAPL